VSLSITSFFRLATSHPLRRSLCIAAVAFYSTTSAAKAIYIDIESETLSEPVTVDGALHNWRGELSDGERAYTYNQIESGWQSGKFSIGYVRRFDYEVDMNSDSAEFFYRVNNKIDLTTGKAYAIDFSVRNSYAHGMHFQYLWLDSDKLKLRLGLTLLQGLRLTQGGISGSARVLNNSDYDFDVGLDYYFSRDIVFKLPADAPTGYGVGNDLDLNYKFSAKHSAEIRARDILAAIYWLDAPHINAHVTSNTKTYDADGWVRYDPVLSGKKSYRNYTQTLPSLVDITWRYEWNSFATMYTGFHYRRLRNLYRFGYQFHFSNDADFDISAVDAGAVRLGGRYKLFKMSLSADTLNFEQAHRLGLTATLAFDF